MNCVKGLGKGMMDDLRTVTDLGIFEESCETRTRTKCLEYDKFVMD